MIAQIGDGILNRRAIALVEIGFEQHALPVPIGKGLLKIEIGWRKPRLQSVTARAQAGKLALDLLDLPPRM